MTDGLHLTTHALRQMLLRDVGPREVADVVEHPEQTYPTHAVGAPRHGWGELTTHQRGPIAVITAHDTVHGPSVVTVLYRTPDRYQTDQQRPDGRRLSRVTRRRIAAELRRRGGTPR